MTNKERLEQIKYEFGMYKELSESDEKWLIKQLEESLEYAETVKLSNDIFYGKIEKLQTKVDAYKQGLDEIEKEGIGYGKLVAEKTLDLFR